MKAYLHIATLVTLAAAPLSPADALAQITVMERSPELERLTPFLGTWDREPTGAQPSGRPEPNARLTANWGPGDVWMTWEADIRFPDGTILHGRRQIAWDEREEVYRWTWIDTQSAIIHQGSARWIDASSLELVGEPFVWHDGTKFQFKTVYRLEQEGEIAERGWRALNDQPFEETNNAVWRRTSDAG